MKYTILIILLCAAAFAQDLRSQAGSAIAAHTQAQAALAEAEAQAADALVAARAALAVVRDARVAEQRAGEAARIALDEYVATLKAPVDTRPGEDLDWGVRPKPAPGEYDWIAEAGEIRSTRGLGTVQHFGTAYRLSRTENDEHIIFGVMDAAGAARVGGTWGQGGDNDLTYPGDERASATFVGMTGVASVSLSFGSHHNRAMRTGDVMAFDIGLRGPNDTFAIRANGSSDHVQLDGCWFLHQDPNFDYSQTSYASGLHIDNWGTLVLRNQRWRGETPGSPGLKLREHIYYLKSGRISTLVENCHLYGGNRSGFQKRPDAEGHMLPTDRFMARGNFADGYGTNHEVSDGGALLTVWVSNGGTYIYDNVATNFRYQALVVSGQGPARNFPFLASGNQHDVIYVAGNRFIAGPATERSTVSISSADRVHLWANEFEGKVKLDAEWNFKQQGTLNGLTSIHLDVAPEWDLWKYDPAIDSERRLTPEEVEALLIK